MSDVKFEGQIFYANDLQTALRLAADWLDTQLPKERNQWQILTSYEWDRVEGIEDYWVTVIRESTP